TDGIASLLDKSLLQLEEGADPGLSRDEGGEPRFLMLETIREYALERLVASGAAAAIRHAHAAYYLALAEAELGGAVQGMWLNRLQQEHDNLRAALDWIVEQGDVDTGLRFAIVLKLFWFMRGHLIEGRERLAQVLALGKGSIDARAKALDSAGLLARY